MSVPRDSDLPQHSYGSGAHYGVLPIAALPSGTTTGDIFYWSGSNWTISDIAGVVSGSIDTNKVKVSSDDTTADYLEFKLSGTGGITLFEFNDGGNEIILISGSPSASFDAIDAKGDLLVGTADDTVDNLTAGADGASLVAASGETTGLKWRKHNMTATAAPTVNDDTGDGYEVGSLWYDTTNDKAYTALDVTATAAVWKEITAAPTAGTITVQEVDGSPSVTADTIKFPNGTLTDNGSGDVTYTPAGGGGGTPNVAVYTRNSTNYTTTSTTFTDIDGTNLNLALTTGANRVRVSLSAAVSSTVGSAGANIFLDLLVDGTSVSGGEGIGLTKPNNSSTGNQNISFSYVTDALSAGSHTFKLQWLTSSGTATMFAGSGGGPILNFAAEEIQG